LIQDQQSKHAEILTLDEDIQVNGDKARDVASGSDLVTAVGGSSLLVAAGSIVVHGVLGVLGLDLGRSRNSCGLIVATTVLGGRGGSSKGKGGKAEESGDSRELHFR
jgi:hypothetical protein